MICQNCGKRIKREGYFCPNCGASLDEGQVNSIDSKSPDKTRLILIAVVLFVIIGIIGVIIAISDPDSGAPVARYAYGTYQCYVQNGSSNEYIRDDTHSISLYPFDDSSFPLQIADNHGQGYISVNGRNKENINWALENDEIVITGDGDTYYCKLIDNNVYSFYMRIDGLDAAFFLMGYIPSDWEQIDENTRICYR